jgi:sensor histidine kinase YesM
MSIYQEYPFVFSPKYRLLRHLIFWLVQIPVFSFLFKLPGTSYWHMHIMSALWIPAFILYSYPIMYWLIPRYLLPEKYLVFALLLMAWAVAGYFLNYLFRLYVLFPVSDQLQYSAVKNPWAATSYLAMNVMAGFACMIVLFEYWIKKQKEYLVAEKEKAMAELQLLKAQVHPHFLFNTLNNIYAFSLENSSKTPQMILKLSSLLSYMLYDCKASEVLLEKEMEIMNNYIDLEKERYGTRLEISVNMEGDMSNKYIAPLLILPFLENAFKHGAAEQLEKPWLSMDISVRQQMLRCKVVNSKNEMSLTGKNGIGIENVRKRLAYLYPGKHDLKLSDEGNFFVVSLLLELDAAGAGKTDTGITPAVKEDNTI